MRDFQERKRIRNLFNSPAVSILLLIITLFLARSVYDVYNKNRIARMNREDSDRRLAVLKEQEDRLAASLGKLKTDRGVEEELRDKFQIMKPGEEVLVVVDQNAARATSSAMPTVAADTAGRQNFWQKLNPF